MARSCRASAAAAGVLVVLVAAGIGCGDDSAPSPPLFADDFESYAENSDFPLGPWTDVGYGQVAWKVVKDAANPGRSKVSALQGYWGGAYAGDASWGDYRVSCMVRHGTVNAVMARYQNSSDCYVLAIRTHPVGELVLTRGIGGTTLQSIAFASTPATWYELAMEVKGSAIGCFVNGVLQFRYEDATPVPRGKIGIWGADAWFDDVLVTR